jgi:glycosyltransferase involved in cell wall biosynthesis
VISFVVPAYNEERLLGHTLASIHQAARDAGEPYELVVVDDASTDATADVARANGARVVPVAFRQIARVRNAGAAATTGNMLIFVDADTTVPAETLRATIAVLKSGAAGGGATLEFEGALPRWAAIVQPVFGRFMRAARLAAGCYFFCARQAFERAGGFDETLYAGEELALSLALRRQGRMIILRERAISSGRKLRTHSGVEMLRLTARLLRGRRTLRSREGLGMWYGERRADTHPETLPGARTGKD